MTLSVAPGKTTRMRTRAVTAPAISEPAMTRADRNGLGHGCCLDVLAALGGVGVDAHGGLALAVGGGALRLSVASMPVAHPGQMAGMCAEVVLGEVELGELAPGGDAGLGEDVAQVEGDRPG